MEDTGTVSGIRDGFRQLSQAFLRLLYPPVCLLCRAPGHADLDLCLGCRDELPWFVHGCQACARALPEGAGPLCGACLKRPPPFDATCALFHYAAPVDRLITGLKYRGRLTHARLLGELWSAHAPVTALPALLLPVPLHPERLRERGFNQSLELARPLSRALGIPLAADRLLRVRATRAQQGLKGKARRSNVHDAFRLRPGPLPTHVAIVDDVMTTGSTVGEIAWLLKRAGVKRVEVWTLARA
ncbi:MAG: ComF family protein [Thioalkalivibrio sp.]